MKKTLGFVSVAALAVAAAYGAVQASGPSLLANFGKSLFEAKSVRSTYTIQTIGSTSESFSVALKKPNMARVETPMQIIVADGKEVTTYTKADNTYFKRPETPGDVKSFLASDDVSIFAGFFDADAYQSPRAKALGQKILNGESLNLVSTSTRNKVTTYFLDASDNVAHKAEIDVDSTSGKVTRVLNTSSLELNSELPASTFVFEPPADARQLSADEIASGRWYTDFDEALKIAKSSGKRVFVDFMATWCGPCKMLDETCFHTPQFKALGKKYVFCRIDVDEQPSLAARFHAESIPLQVVTDSSGEEIDQLLGWGGADRFFDFLKKNAG